MIPEALGKFFMQSEEKKKNIKFIFYKKKKNLNDFYINLFLLKDQDLSINCLTVYELYFLLLTFFFYFLEQKKGKN